MRSKTIQSMKSPEPGFGVGPRWVAGLLTVLLASAVLPANSYAGGFKFPVGLTYTSGAQEVMDGLRINQPITDDAVIPVGISFMPYYELDMGLSFGASLGPSSLILIQESSSFGTSDELNFIIPVGGFVRYTLLRDKNVSPYVRAGVTYNIVGGDYIESGDIGVLGAVGVEFWRNKAVGMGLEVGYSTSDVTIKAGPRGGERSADYGQLTVSIMAVF